MHPLIEAELASLEPHDGIPFRAYPKHTHKTWAKTFTSLPELYLQPATLPEIKKVLKLARLCRRRVTTTGAGHSPSDLTCTSSWLVNLDRFNRVLDVDQSTGIIRMESGIRLWQLSEELHGRGLAMPNLGSINEQSIAGAISTGTHGSTLRHGLVSEDVLALQITLASGETRSCSPTRNAELFRAALLSLGGLGIITEVTFRAVPAFSLRWSQVIDADTKMISAWDKDLWTQAEFVRVWWFPYTRRAVVWKAEHTDEPHFDPPKSYYDAALGFHVYHGLLYLAQYLPRLLPSVEWFVFGMQYGFRNGSTVSAVQPSRKALLMNCLYSQFVNEWALPLHKGPEALSRLRSWLNHLTPEDPDYVLHGIPFSADGLYVHAPVEVRVSDTTLSQRARPYLDPTCKDGPTLYLNATLYRPYLNDPPCMERYYEAFEWLMKDLGGRPHWAKNFGVQGQDIEGFYGKDLEEWRGVRMASDPDGMFVGGWHRNKVLGSGRLNLEEAQARAPRKVHDGGVLVTGMLEENLPLKV